MPNPRKRRHRFNAKGPKRARRPPRIRRPRKARPVKKPVEEKKESGPECEAVKHYGDAWDYENYEKEELKAKGLFL